ncbi:hypothetical protein BY458DRAFT_497090 [Sporodiniella umbellata]|nr:hypothetical protein BY458DRAFT_497090 [Sporodiniella umbellata]
MKAAFAQVILLMLVIGFCRYCTAAHLSAIDSFFIDKAFYDAYSPMLIPINLLLFLLAVGLTVIVWLVITFVVVVLSLFLRLSCFFTKPAYVNSKAIRFSMLLALLLFYFIPAHVLYVFYYIVWLTMTASSRLSAVRSDLPCYHNIYRYRQSWLLFLTSLLPYHVPGVVVFVKNLMVGWTRRHITLDELTHHLPYVLFLVYLTSFANTRHLSHRIVIPAIYVCSFLVANQVLFGSLYPLAVFQKNSFFTLLKK